MRVGHVLLRLACRAVLRALRPGGRLVNLGGSAAETAPIDSSTLRGRSLRVLDLSDPAVEPVDVVAAGVRRAFAHTTPERIVIAPDCGMKYLPRDSAEGKMRAMSGAAALLRREL